MGQAGISDLDHGMSVNAIQTYFHDLRVGAINEAVRVCREDYQTVIQVLDQHWVGESAEKFKTLLSQSANITADTIENMTGVLATQLNTIIEVWNDQERTMIID